MAGMLQRASPCCVLQTMSYETFIQLYEKPRIPVVVTGLQDSWQAQELWNQTDLAKRFGDHKFKVCTTNHAHLASHSALVSEAGNVLCFP